MVVKGEVGEAATMYRMNYYNTYAYLGMEKKLEG